MKVKSGVIFSGWISPATGVILALASLTDGFRVDAQILSSDPPGSASVKRMRRSLAVEGIRNERAALNNTLWQDEVRAQKHRKIVIKLWDALRAARGDPAGTVGEVKNFAIGKVIVPTSSAVEETGSFRVRNFSGEKNTWERAQWHQFLDDLERQGFRLAQSEWHQVRYRGKLMGEGNVFEESDFAFILHMESPRPVPRLIVEGTLRLRTSSGNSSREIEVLELRIIQSTGSEVFVQAGELYMSEKVSATPITPWIACDLNGDGLPELVFPSWNAVFWNRSPAGFSAREPLLEDPVGRVEGALIADFTGDGRPDLFLTPTRKAPRIYPGSGEDGFESTPIVVDVPDAKWGTAPALTAGDIDADGDLDLWIGQYKGPYAHGAMPTPFFDANDSDPGYLLVNNGSGLFSDRTVAAGLGEKRYRHMYTASFVDLDEDGDLDLLTVSDFAGVDAYRNDGSGNFQDVGNEMFAEKKAFGMSHAFGDFDLDGRQDFLMVGMNSTTVERLESLGLGREYLPEISRMRVPMTYGNRIYLRRPGEIYATDLDSRATRETGWSWGSAALDIENDGDDDIYVANGMMSGESAQDYCTQYWRHDIYLGDSTRNYDLLAFFADNRRALDSRKISWNGYEHNRLLVNLSGRGFLEVGFLLGVALEFDCRSVLAEDLDLDGRVDLLVEAYDPGRLGRGVLFVNRTENTNNWIGVRLVSEAGYSPIGAKITVKTDSRTHSKMIVTGDVWRGQRSNVRHFGLGRESRVNSIEIRWTDGHVRSISYPKVGRYHLVRR